MTDDSRRKILARRASFVAAALAGVAGCGKEPAGNPEPCLAVPIRAYDAGPAPVPSLSAPPLTTAPPAYEEPPTPCLSVAVPRDAGPPRPIPHPIPHPCLSPKRPDDL